MKVTCEVCGHDATLTDPAPIDTPDGPQAPEVRWQCDCKVDPDTHPGEECDCEALNVIEGHPGELGEGTLNPAASALTDEQLAEAALRRGVIHQLHLGGSMAPKGTSEAKS